MKYTSLNIPKFPINPSIGATHNPSGKKEYIWNGDHWTVSKNHNHLPSFSYDENEPTGDVKPGDIWINEIANTVNIWDGEDWYSINNSPTGPTGPSPAFFYQENEPPTDQETGSFWYNSSNDLLSVLVDGGIWKPAKGTSGPIITNIQSDIFKEIPSGSIDGINFMYNLTHTPLEGSAHVYLNGLLQREGDDYDYTIAGNQIFFVLPPYEDSLIACTYSYQGHIRIDNEIPIKLPFENQFELLYTPVIGRESVYLNGLLQRFGVDYVISGKILTFVYDLDLTDTIIVDYMI